MKRQDLQGTEERTSKVSRRQFLRSTAAAAGGAVVAGSLAGSAMASGANLPVIRRAAFARSTEITFMHIWGTPPGEKAASKKHPATLLIEAFNAKNTGVTVKGETPSGDYLETLQKAQAQIAAGKPPALMATPWAFINYALEGLNITPLDTIGGDELKGVLANYKEEVLPLVQQDGKTLGLPFALSVPVMYYNNDLLKQAKVDPAVLFKDWTSFKEQGNKVKDVTGNPILGLGNNADWEAQSIVQCNGGNILDAKGQPAWTSPEAVAAMQMVADLNKAGLYLQSTTSESRAAFVGGSLAIWMGSIASLGGLTNDVKFDMQTTPFPVFTGKPRKMSTGGSFVGSYARDKDQQAGAWEFLKFAGSKEGMDIWLKTGYLNATTYDEPVLTGQDAGYTELKEGATRETAWPGARGGEISKVWRNYVERIWSGDISAKDGCEQALKEAKPLFPTS